MFEANFHATYTRPSQEDDLFACIYKPNESLREFIRRFSDIRNTIPDMIGDQVVIAFKKHRNGDAKVLTTKKGKALP